MRLLSALLCLLIAAHGHAEIKPGVMIDFAAGRSQHSNSRTSEYDAAFSGQIAYQINPYFAIEGQFVALGIVSPLFDSLTTMFDKEAYYTPSANYGVSAIGSLPINERFDLQAKLGIGRTRFESGRLGAKDYYKTDSNVGLALRMALGSHWALKIEHQYFNQAKVNTTLLGGQYHF
ncbi:outer membrane beta-barrel protein [Iodobacter arcticus]|uniref:Outer membrane beta-barrel protein n=1 Tax=Iodobacter arcticus TaxID=590593 RepID=A0ABW2R335_9NEIS